MEETNSYKIMVYSAYLRDSKRSFATTNLVRLASDSGLNYHRLVYHFVRKGKFFYQTDDIIIIRSNELIRGNQVAPIHGKKFK